MTAITAATAEEIISAVQKQMGEVSGSGTQLFAEDALLEKLAQTFNLVFLKRGWEQYRRWHSLTIDGSTGKFTSGPFEDVSGAVEHFLGVFLHRSQMKLPILPSTTNPYILTGTNALYWTSLPVTDDDYYTKRLQWWPLESDTDIDVCVRLHPGVIVPSTVLHLDKDLLTYGTAWMALEDDGINPGSAQKNQTLFDLRYRDILQTLADQPIRVATQNAVPSQWTEQP